MLEAGQDDCTQRAATVGARDPEETVDLMVVGAHLSGQPLNGDLLAGRATLIGPVCTAADYRLWRLGTTPPRPGLLRVSSGGSSVVGERWRMPVLGFGALVAALQTPLTIGSIALSDGTRLPGFLVEHAATPEAEDITHHGGWLAYLGQQRSLPVDRAERVT